MEGVLAKTKFKRSQCATSLTERFPDKGVVNSGVVSVAGGLLTQTPFSSYFIENVIS